MRIRKHEIRKTIFWLGRLVLESILQPTKRPTPKALDCLVLTASSNVQNLTQTGLRFSDKIDPVTEQLMGLGLATVCYFQPGLGDLFTRIQTRFKYHSLSRRLVSKIPHALMTGGGNSVLSRAKVSLWSDFLANLNPKSIFGIGLDRELCFVARSLGIRTYEVQHGVLGKNGFMEMATHYSETSTSALPDYFLSWDDYYTALAEQSGIPARTIGHPFFSLAGFDSELKHLKSDHTEKKERSVVTALTTWDVSGKFSPFGILTPELVVMMRVCEEFSHAYDLVIRVHPYVSHKFGFWRAKAWLETNFPLWRIQTSQDIHLSELLTRSKLVLSQGSSGIFESNLLGARNAAPKGSFEGSFPPSIEQEVVTDLELVRLILAAKSQHDENPGGGASSEATRLLKVLVEPKKPGRQD